MGTGKQHTRSSRLGICVDTLLRSGRPDPYPTCNHWCLHSVDWIQGNSNMTYMTSWTVTCPETTAFLSFWIRSNLQLAVQGLAVAREISTIRFRAVAFPPLPSAWSQHVTTHCLELFLWGVTQQAFHIFSPSKNCPKSAQTITKWSSPLLVSLMFHLTCAKYPCEEQCPCIRFTRRGVTCRLNQWSGRAFLGDESDGDGDGDGDDDAHDGGSLA